MPCRYDRRGKTEEGDYVRVALKIFRRPERRRPQHFNGGQGQRPHRARVQGHQRRRSRRRHPAGLRDLEVLGERSADRWQGLLADHPVHFRPSHRRGPGAGRHRHQRRLPLRPDPPGARGFPDRRDHALRQPDRRRSRQRPGQVPAQVRGRLRRQDRRLHLHPGGRVPVPEGGARRQCGSDGRRRHHLLYSRPGAGV